MKYVGCQMGIYREFLGRSRFTISNRFFSKREKWKKKSSTMAFLVAGASYNYRLKFKPYGNSVYMPNINLSIELLPFGHSYYFILFLDFDVAHV